MQTLQWCLSARFLKVGCKLVSLNGVSPILLIGSEPALEKFPPPLEKFVGYSLKILDIVQKIWALLRKLFAPPGDPSWPACS